MPATTAAPAPRRRGLTAWIAVALAWAVLIAALVLLGFVERFAREHATRTATTALQQIGWQMRDQLDRGMAYRYEELRVLAGLRELQPGSAPEQVRETLERVQQSFPLYAWLGYATRDGVVEAATGDLLRGQNVAQRPWFQGGSQGAFVGDLHAAVLLEKLLPSQSEPWRFVDIAMPVYDARGGLAGVVGAHLSWQWARDLQRSLLAPVASSYQVELFVVDAAGQVLLGPAGTEGKPLGLADAIAALRAPASRMRAWHDGLRYATAIVPTAGHGNYPGLGWVVVARQSESEAFADYHQLQREMLLGGVIVCLLATLCAPLLARRLTRPLSQLTQALEVRARDPSAPIPRLTQYREVDLLSRVLADAADKALLYREELERLNASLEERIERRTEQIRASQAQLRTITDNIPALVADVDADLRFRFANQAYAAWFGVEPDELIGTPMAALYGDDAMRQWAPQLERVLRGERVEFERSMVVGGRRQHSNAIYLPQRDADGRVDGFHALVFDVTVHKELELRLQAEATHDALTGLPNRRHVLQYLPKALVRADRTGHHLALLFLDLNGFKKVNDTHGHEAGDQLLQQVGRRLQGVLRSSDTVARLAGDEFVVLLEPVSDPAADPQRVAAKIDAALREPFALDAATVRVSVSTGGAVYPPGSGRSAEDLLSGADTAMYAAKKSGQAGR
ncbi:diguanylate cyclase domain-containing protein [Pseudorhodoferax sp. Leaf267]|uniref:diguanylate cyclase domain-containing protein n=1 Tax=Pseudorhodoferax sp. Leaf267 TaxID=1736316 RepID=UPI0006FBEDF1|nr:diguanylate cyclase [Pseudorhodoferax sp. Leaf267]KQP23514.1 hypothetical protein ASF43_06600 [Pseudorhodoferax sp. Leaf267]